MCRWIFCVLMFCILVFLSSITGCKQTSEQDITTEQPVEEPAMITTELVPDYIDGALSATGGHQLWLQTKEIEYDCVVTFYKPDGSFYLTNQHHYIKPWSRSIRITATEPHGKIVCEFKPDDFEVLEGAVRKDGLPQGLCERELAEAVLEAVSGSVSFLEKGVMFTRMDKPVRKEGLWYYAIERVEPGEVKESESEKNEAVKPAPCYWSEMFYYQRVDSLLVDMMWFANLERQEYLAVRCYDYRGIEKSNSQAFNIKGVFVPRKVEIFRSDSKGTFHNKIAEIDIKNCSYSIF
ncbi:MAG: hypothetical protein ACYTFM_03595 [Planctomycetota bacterium]